MIKQISTATSGTVTCTDNKQDLIVVHDAASLAATLTVTLPASPNDGQKVIFASTLGVTVLTISSALAIVGTLTSLIAGGYWTLAYESSTNKWYRIA
jgi:hypothetical protein